MKFSELRLFLKAELPPALGAWIYSVTRPTKQAGRNRGILTAQPPHVTGALRPAPRTLLPRTVGWSILCTACRVLCLPGCRGAHPSCTPSQGGTPTLRATQTPHPAACCDSRVGALYKAGSANSGFLGEVGASSGQSPTVLAVP